MTNLNNKSGKELFNQLNSLRTENGKKAYTSLKESKSSMIVKIKGELKLVEDNTNVFRIVDLARDLNIDPKIARRRLRTSDNVPPTATENKWIFHTKHKRVLKSIINN